MSNDHERRGLTGITVEITESRLGAMIGLTRKSGFMCESVSAASEWLLSRGFTLICDNYAHKYDISDEGGTWVVKVSQFHC